MVPVPMSELFAIAARQEHHGNLAEADRLLNHILGVAPNQPDALHMSGIVAFRLGRPGEAVAKIEQAIAYGVDIALYLRNICEVYRTLNRLDEAVAAAQRASALAPSDPLCLHNLAVIHYERVEIEDSLDCAERALLMAPDMAGPHFARAEALLIKGDWAQGWEEYEWRFRIGGASKLMPPTDRPQWDGAPFDDGTLLLVADQGFGDVIQFSRYIPWVLERCPDVAIASSAEMIPVLRQLLPAERIFIRWEDCPPYKAFAALSGLPRLHGTRVGSCAERDRRICGPIRFGWRAGRNGCGGWRRTRTRASASSGPGGRRITTTGGVRRSWRILRRSPRCPGWRWCRCKRVHRRTRPGVTSAGRR